MSWRMIDIAEDGRYLHFEREWMVIKHGEEELGRVPLSDVLAVMVHGHYANYSDGLLRGLAERDIPLVLCDARHEPVAILTAVAGHHAQAGRAQTQAAAGKPLKDRIWRALVRKKIEEQARTLSAVDKKKAAAMIKMVRRVSPGDKENMEARAARYYWRHLFGPDFRRDRDEPGLNAHLNYGYTILRSAVARAVTGAGLIPSLGVGHINARNNFCLADDLVEPFRPLVDRLVWQMREDWSGDLTTEAKAQLAGLLAEPVETPEGQSNVFRIITLAVQSLVRNFERLDSQLYFPKAIEISKTPQFPDFPG